jgi:hypothetical protein
MHCFWVICQTPHAYSLHNWELLGNKHGILDRNDLQKQLEMHIDIWHIWVNYNR